MKDRSIMEEEQCSASSPRRILSFSRNRRDDVSDDRSPRFGVSVIFIIWAYFPDRWLHYIGIYYYPSRYWALAVPTYVMVTIVLAIGFYIGLNFMSTPPPTSLNTIFDEYSREPRSNIPSTNDDELPIEPISDIGIIEINEIMFGNVK